MKRFAIVVSLLAAGIASGGCSGASTDEDSGAADEDIIAQDPLAMPKPILTFLSTHSWGTHHLEWHTVRNWDRLGADEQAYAKKQGWARADLQEGAKGNGLEFLAMHRVMIRTLIKQDPADKALFDGWDSPPTDCKDKNDPCATKQPVFDADKLKAIDKLQNHLADFTSDDDFGLFLETSLRPTTKNPDGRATDHGAGLHNYMHNRYADPKSKIDIGDPSLNLQNKRFWRLHGWIESRWTAFRALKKLSDNDPAYEAAIAKADAMLNPTAKGLPGGTYGVSEPPPDSLRKFFENNND